MQLIPAWAPNVHPMIVHFPIVLVLLAVVADLLHIVRPRLRGLGAALPALYLLGALSSVAAYVSGRIAADTVFIPGITHGLVDEHGNWALATTISFVVVATLRPLGRLVGLADTRTTRLLFLSLALAVLVLVQQTAERGARLVYDQGVGVVTGRGSVNLDVPDSAGAEADSR
jgi:uncharacterized membrane protein